MSGGEAAGMLTFWYVLQGVRSHTGMCPGLRSYVANSPCEQKHSVPQTSGPCAGVVDVNETPVSADMSARRCGQAHRFVVRPGVQPSTPFALNCVVVCLEAIYSSPMVMNTSVCVEKGRA